MSLLQRRRLCILSQFNCLPNMKTAFHLIKRQTIPNFSIQLAQRIELPPQHAGSWSAGLGYLAWLACVTTILFITLLIFLLLTRIRIWEMQNVTSKIDCQFKLSTVALQIIYQYISSSCYSSVSRFFLGTDKDDVIWHKMKITSKIVPLLVDCKWSH